MTIISADEISRRIFDEENDHFRLYVSPILDPETQINRSSCSFDIRLGTHFIISKRTHFSHINPFGLYPDRDPATEEKIRNEFLRYQEELYVPFSHELALHPRQYILGVTLEYFRFPLDLAAYVIGRSSWGRLGLVIAMATFVHPGYTGVITLELENLGDAPVTLIVGARIGQLVFHKIEESEEVAKVGYRDVYTGKYVAAVRPSHSLIYEDRERMSFYRYRQVSKKASEHLHTLPP